MKIALINIYQGAVERGAETYVSEIYKRLKKSNNVKILSFSIRPKPRWPIVWRLYIDPFGIQSLLYTLKLLPTLWKEKFDIVIPVNGGWQPALVRLITWIYGGKMVISGQSGIGWDDRNNLWCFPDCFVALSEFAGKWAKRANPLVKIEIISNGVDVEKFAGEKSKLKLGLEKPVILCVGALTESKRQDLAVKAVSRLKQGSLLLVGKGEAENRLCKLGERLLRDRFMISSYGFQEMPKVYKSADLFTYPTNPNESFGIAIVEAMASGLAVIANDDPIRREIVGDAGLFIKPIDTVAYAQSLEKAVQTDWGDVPLTQARKYNWDNISIAYNDLFERLIK